MKKTMKFKDENEVKKELESYRMARIDEYNYLLEADDIASARLFRDQAITGMPTTKGRIKDLSDVIENTIDEQWNKYMHLRCRSVMKSCEVKRLIDELDDGETKMIMLHKYILLKQNLKPKTWEEVSEEIGYSRTSVIEHAKKGIRDIYTNHKK